MNAERRAYYSTEMLALADQFIATASAIDPAAIKILRDIDAEQNVISAEEGREILGQLDPKLLEGFLAYEEKTRVLRDKMMQEEGAQKSDWIDLAASSGMMERMETFLREFRL